MCFLDSVGKFAVGDIPGEDCSHRVCGCEKFSVGRECDGPCVAAVVLRVELAKFLPGGDVPELDRRIITAGSERRAVGREGNAVDARAELARKCCELKMSEDLPKLPPGGNVPHSNEASFA